MSRVSGIVPVGVSELEALLEEEVPCGGIRNVHIARSCDRPAALKDVGPHQCGIPRANYKCLQCWQVLVAHLCQRLATQGYLRCVHCNERFHSVESFCDYRPF